MEYLRSDILPYLALGGAVSFVTMLYSGQLVSAFNPSMYVERAVSWIMGMVGAKPGKSSIGGLLSMGISFIVQGLLIGVAIYGVQRLGLRIPSIAALV